MINKEDINKAPGLPKKPNAAFIYRNDSNSYMVKKEIDFCLKLREEQGGCSFGKSTKCEQCSAISVLRKLYSGEVLDGQKLSLEDWKEKIK